MASSWADRPDDAEHAVSVASSWHREKEFSNAGTQTSEIRTQSAGVQAVTSKSIEIQTDPEPETSLEFLHDSSPALGNFLKRVMPAMEEALEDGTRTTAFDGYEVFWEETTDTVECTHTLCHLALMEELQCTDMSWNCTGSVLAVAYGRHDHENWCTHKSALTTWNIDRRSLNSNKADSSIEIASCLMSVTFHPELPSVVAGGTFNGEIVLFDLSQPEGQQVVASSGFQENAHTEPVTQLRWILDEEKHRRRTYKLVSCCGDGKILVWRVHFQKTETSMALVDRYNVSTRDAGPVVAGGARTISETGVTSLSFTCEGHETFVAGTEGGAVVKCNLRPNAAIAALGTLPESLSPVTMKYQAHAGPVYGVACSPFHRNVFLSISTDSSCCIYSLLQGKPLLTLEPMAGYLFDVQWSPSRPLVFAATTGDGRLLLFDLNHSRINAAASLEANAKRHPVYCCSFNHKRPHLIATGDSSGVVKVWHLSNQLFTQIPREPELLDELASAALD